AILLAVSGGRKSQALKCISEDAYPQIKTIGLGYIQARRENSEGEIEKGTKKRFWYQKNLQGEVIRTIPLDFDFWLNRYGEGRISIPWYRLQTELRNLLPSEIVKANHCCVDITPETSSIIIGCISDQEISSNPFAHWSTPDKEQTENIDLSAEPTYNQQFQAKLVVAADGINSTVRQLIYANSDLSPWAKPQYSGFSAIGCLQIDHVSDEIMQQLEKKYLQGDMVVTLRNDAPQLKSQNIESPRLILIRRGANALGYLFHTSLSLNALQNKSSEAIINLAADLLIEADFPTIFAQIVKLSNPAILIDRPYYIHPANIPHEQPIWSSDRLVLAGDAAHGMPPFAAQGANQGLEDAAIIGTAIANIIHHNDLDNQAIIDRQFSKYEQLRRPLIEQVQEATMHNHTWSQEKWEKYGDTVYCRDVENMTHKFKSNHQ
ncbi:MAG: NAD(P)/FAD-dependent oxidoreductase, partial [Waterburya sp.]